jgi:hypothetical protein
MKGWVEAMKKRYLLILLAAIAAALLLVLPGTALAAENHITVNLDQGQSCTVDLESGRANPRSGADFSVAYTYEQIDTQGHYEWVLHWDPVPDAWYGVNYAPGGQVSYDDITSWTDVTHIQFGTRTNWDGVMVVMTAEGDYYKARFSTDGARGTIDYELIVPDPRVHQINLWYEAGDPDYYVDFDAGTVLINQRDAGSDLYVGCIQQGLFLQGGVNGSSYAQIYTGTSTPLSYDTVAWQDLPNVAWETDASTPVWDYEKDAVVGTGDGRYFKVRMQIGSYMFTVYYEELLSNDPPTLLNDLQTCIASPGAGVDPVVGAALKAKVIAASAALDKNNKKTAVNNLNALLDQVRAQSGKKISTTAANEITSQVNAIIAAINAS